MTYQLIHGDARRVSDYIEAESVDLLITSPPYFSLRSYRDGGEHYDGQIGSEPTPGEFVDALIACTADWLTVLKPSGSLFVNLGDKYCSDNRGSGTDAKRGDAKHAPRGAAGFVGREMVRQKSLMGLPWRYAIRCIDELGLILRAEIVWSKPNGLPESVTDRVRRSHEQWFHLTREGRYFAAIDEVREPQTGGSHYGRSDGQSPPGGRLERQVSSGDRGGVIGGTNPDMFNPLGKVPGSVWTIASEPLTVPDDLGVDHFAAFPSELPRRIIVGWSSSGYCTACDEPRRAVVDKRNEVDHEQPGHTHGRRDGSEPDGNTRGINGPNPVMRTVATITGYACACPDITAPTRPAVVLDPFVGTGTTPAVAHLLGRHGVGIDLSRDYLRLAEWRCSSDDRLRNKVLDRSGIPNPKPPAIDGQANLLDLIAEGAA